MSKYEFGNMSEGLVAGEANSVRALVGSSVSVTAMRRIEDALLLGFQSEDWIVRYARRGYTFHLLRFPVIKCAENEVVSLDVRLEHLKASAVLRDIMREDEEHEVVFTCVVGRQNVSNSGTGSVLVLQRFPSSPAEPRFEAALIAVSHITVGEY